MPTKVLEDTAVFIKKADAIKKTAYIRFDCAERLASQERFRLLVSTFLAVFLVTWSISQLAFPNCVEEVQEEFLNFLSIVSSISLLALGLVDYSSNRGLHSYIMLQNAQQLLRIGERLERLAKSHEATHGDLDKVCELYHDALASTGINHDSIDNKLANISRWEWGIFQFANVIFFHFAKLFYGVMGLFLPIFVLVIVFSGGVWAIYTGANFSSCFGPS